MVWKDINCRLLGAIVVAVIILIIGMTVVK